MRGDCIELKIIIGRERGREKQGEKANIEVKAL